MTAGGDIGHTLACQVSQYADGPFTKVKKPTGVVVHITDALPWAGGLQRNPVYFFSNEGTYIGGSYTDASGNVYYYDLDDGNYYADQAGTGNAWQITVVGTSSTIIRISSFGSLVTIYAA